MAVVISAIIGIVVLGTIGVGGLILMMIGGGSGFALGSLAGDGWAIFGAILGGLVGLYFVVAAKGIE